jgi:hypothetical protein
MRRARAANPAAHDGRVRAFPGVVGEFACHVYLPVALPPSGSAQGGALSAFVAAAVACAAASNGTTPALQLHAAAFGGGELHLSLSRTVPVRLPQVPTLTVRLAHSRIHAFAFSPRVLLTRAPRACASQAALRRGLAAAPPPPRLPLRAPCALVNDERTRTFLALEIPSLLASSANDAQNDANRAANALANGAHAPANAANGAAAAARACVDEAAFEAERAVGALRACIAAVDAAFALVGLPRFYDAPRPHVSLAWALGDVAADVASAAAAAQRAGARPPDDWAPRARVVRVAIGQRVVDVWRSSEADDG